MDSDVLEHPGSASETADPFAAPRSVRAEHAGPIPTGDHRRARVRPVRRPGGGGQRRRGRRAGPVVRDRPRRDPPDGDRSRRDHRLPSPLHAPQLRGTPAVEGRARGVGIDVVPGLDHRLGRRPPAPSPLRRPRRRSTLSALGRRRARARVGGALACAPRLDVPRREHLARALRPRPARRPRHRARGSALRTVLHRNPRAAVRTGLPVDR